MNTDTTILQRIAAQDKQAVKECVDQYNGLIWSIIRNAGFHNGEAEDLVQNIFIEIWKSASRFDPNIRSEAVFISMITRRRMIDFLRKKITEKDRFEFREELPSVPAYSDDRLADSFDVQSLRDNIGALNEDEQQVLKLSTVLGLSQSEIASKTGLPLGTVKSHMRRGIQKLHKLMQAPEMMREGA